MRNRRQANHPTKASVKRLAKKCRCGKLGYERESGAMDAVISGRFGRAGVRVYQCPDSGLWHTTSKASVRPTAENETFTPSAAPTGELTDAERVLIHAVRFVRRLRRQGSGGDALSQANNAAQRALAEATRLAP